MMGFEGDWDKFPVDCQAIVVTLGKNAAPAVYKAATAYAGDVAKSPATPVDTGQYRNSIRADPPVIENDFPVCYVGSPMPQVRRLELGFYDMDKLGRIVNQHPRPHWKPMFDMKKAEYLAIITKVLDGRT